MDENNFSIHKMIREDDEIAAIIESMTVVPIEEGYSVNNSLFKAEIKVKGNEGQIPHFHVTFGSYESCLCIFEAAYFNHALKYIELTDNHLNGLNIFLMSPDKEWNDNHPNLPKRSYWDQIVNEWAARNTTERYEHDTDWQTMKKPDYRLTRENRYDGPNKPITKVRK